MFSRFVQSKRMPHAIYWRMFNIWPALRGTGMRVTRATSDWTELDVRLKLSWRTVNYVGTIFGGSIYAAVDPFYMVMIIRQIGDDYVVWDKSARVTFKRPGTETLYAEFRVPASEVEDLKREADEVNSFDRTYWIDLKDADGKVYATVEKVIFIARKDWFKAREERRAQRTTEQTTERTTERTSGRTTGS
jgi:acyl-coenzyme A thioesterase PaaI-like protein